MTDPTATPANARANSSNALETPEQVYNKWLNHSLRIGFPPQRAEMYARHWSVEHRKKLLGQDYHLTESAAHFMAASLRLKRMPRGAQRWVAQHCLKGWLPHMSQGERAEVLASLRDCSPTQLGPDLVAILAQEA